MLDHGADDHTALAEALTSAGARVVVTADKRTALLADGLVIAGRAPAADVMPALRAIGADQVVDRRLAGGRAVLAIGVGMHLMFAEVVQDGTVTEGLGEWAGVVDALGSPPGAATVDVHDGSALFAGLGGSRFDVVHAHAARTFPLLDDWPAETRLVVPVVTWTAGDVRYVAAIENGPLVGLQVRPESSGPAGAELLARWVSSLPAVALSTPDDSPPDTPDTPGATA
ncbi:imidazole glycerol phosphate synthase subunit HisH [Cellulomonas xylanilytica]|uniref:Imidazole glycerol phosphate synthase subunit HisH n=1 Tax=Cellulomonas xylanilytica TaxID=233583 RepID=A0A510V613_9CELL|nr:imidazole glycerol phosphate synthase subunit HisH [Cellulomonas xylanilytica]